MGGVPWGGRDIRRGIRRGDRSKVGGISFHYIFFCVTGNG